MGEKMVQAIESGRARIPVAKPVAIDQIRNTMTVGELISYLEQFDEETLVYLKHDRGYTYGAIKESRFEDEEIEEEEVEEDDETHSDRAEDQ